MSGDDLVKSLRRLGLDVDTHQVTGCVLEFWFRLRRPSIDAFLDWMCNVVDEKNSRIKQLEKDERQAVDEMKRDGKEMLRGQALEKKLKELRIGQGDGSPVGKSTSSGVVLGRKIHSLTARKRILEDYLSGLKSRVCEKEELRVRRKEELESLKKSVRQRNASLNISLQVVDRAILRLTKMHHDSQPNELLFPLVETHVGNDWEERIRKGVAWEDTDKEEISDIEEQLLATLSKLERTLRIDSIRYKAAKAQHAYMCKENGERENTPTHPGDEEAHTFQCERFREMLVELERKMSELSEVRRQEYLLQEREAVEVSLKARRDRNKLVSEALDVYTHSRHEVNVALGKEAEEHAQTLTMLEQLVNLRNNLIAQVPGDTLCNVTGVVRACGCHEKGQSGQAVINDDNTELPEEASVELERLSSESRFLCGVNKKIRKQSTELALLVRKLDKHAQCISMKASDLRERLGKLKNSPEYTMASRRAFIDFYQKHQAGNKQAN